MQYAIETGNMPASAAAYDDPELKELYPEDLLALFRESIDAAAHGPCRRTGATSPAPSRARGTRQLRDRRHAEESTDFIEDVLHGKTLL